MTETRGMGSPFRDVTFGFQVYAIYPDHSEKIILDYGLSNKPSHVLIRVPPNFLPYVAKEHPFVTSPWELCVITAKKFKTVVFVQFPLN